MNAGIEQSFFLAEFPGSPLRTVRLEDLVLLAPFYGLNIRLSARAPICVLGERGTGVMTW